MARYQITFDGQPDADFEKFKADTDEKAAAFVARRQAIVDATPAAEHKPVVGYRRIRKGDR